MSTPRHSPDHPSAAAHARIRPRTARLHRLELSEIESPVLLRLRSLENPPGPQLAALRLPRQTGQCSGENPTALCLAPGEWLLVGGDAPGVEQLGERLQRRLASGLTAVYDHSDGLAGIRVSGAAAPWLLGKLSCLDFGAANAGANWCARTRMGDAAVTVHCRPAAADDGPGAPGFDLYVDRSVAQALWNLLEASAPHATELYDEFGVFA